MPTPTPEQVSIIEAFANPNGHLQVIARAGSGKTSTAVMGAPGLPEAPALACAFNKDVAKDLQAKMPSAVECRTLNSIGHRAVMRLCGRRVTLDKDKLFALAKELDLPFSDLGDTLALTRAARTAGIVPSEIKTPHHSLLEDSPEAWASVADHYDLDGDPALCRTLLAESIRRGLRGLIDFDDQIYLTACFGAPLQRYPFVLVDEAQDLNALQHQMIKRLVGGRLAYIGDPAQGIYGFRGAMSGSMEHLADHFSPTSLPLTISFRCPQEVIRLAQVYVPDIRPWDQAPQGAIVDLRGQPWSLNEIPWAGAVLCRNNAPLLSLAMALIRARRPVRVLGRDIGKGLERIVKKLNIPDIPGFLSALRDYERAEISRKPRREDQIRDKCASLYALSEDCTTTQELLALIASLFSARAPLALSTIHKAKGMEWKEVCILDDFLIGARATGWQIEQERNLRYVGITRAQHTLKFINTEDY